MGRAKNSLADVSKDGKFQRVPTSFHKWVRAGSGPFPAAAGRYILYVCLACPWANRCLITRSLKGLEDAVAINVVTPRFGKVADDGTKSWVFGEEGESVAGVDVWDKNYGSKSMRALYEKADPDYEGRYTVPVLWDTETEAIVNNESSEILQMLNSEFNAFAKYPDVDLRPDALVGEIDKRNDWIYNALNNGVYRAGFARSQEAYSGAVAEVFDRLDEIEELLGDGRRYLLGEELVETDVRLFVTLVRFDPVYVQHFKCNLRRIADYPFLWRYTRRLMANPRIGNTINLTHIKDHYFGSHESINPLGIVPEGPVIDWSLAKDEE